MFNLLANIATITNFLVLLLGNSLLFRSLAEISFVWGPFDYSVANGGLCGFLSFFLSYGCAQTVNFIVQRKAVFHANNKLGPAIVIYIIAVIIVYFICLYVPTLIVAPLSGIVGGFAPYVANCVNILIQVLTLYPTMKFLVMKKTEA
jgi:putative flippase GtrA